MIKDCAPKRLLIQQQTEVNRIFALQQSIEEMRNRFLILESSLIQLITQSQEYITQEIKLLESPKKTSNRLKPELKHITASSKKNE